MGGWLEWDEWAISAALAGETKGHCFASSPVSVMKLFKKMCSRIFQLIKMCVSLVPVRLIYDVHDVKHTFHVHFVSPERVVFLFPY